MLDQAGNRSQTGLCECCHGLLHHTRVSAGCEQMAQRAVAAQKWACARSSVGSAGADAIRSQRESTRRCRDGRAASCSLANDALGLGCVAGQLQLVFVHTVDELVQHGVLSVELRIHLNRHVFDAR